MASPIADLTYRNYDGPLEPPVNRWWAIAKMSIRLSLKKRGFWFWTAFSTYWYAILLIIFYVNETIISNAGPNAKNLSIFKTLVWKDQFLNAFSMSQLFLFILALLMGAGTIANDNRAKALLVYLSKPCTKTDYVIGKWLGIFVPMTAVAAVPTILFYFYCLMSYRSYGFWTQDPWLLVRLLGMILLPGICYSSIALAVSSLFQQGRLAGGVFAGLYFLSNFITVGMGGAYTMSSLNGGDSPEIVKSLFYCSVDGIQIGMAKIILHTNGSALIPIVGNINGVKAIVPEPSTWIFLPAFFLICGISIVLAWSQIRAVEVVR